MTTEEGVGWEDKAWYLENPYFFMLAVLVDADAGESRFYTVEDSDPRCSYASFDLSAFKLDSHRRRASRSSRWKDSIHHWILRVFSLSS